MRAAVVDERCRRSSIRSIQCEPPGSVRWLWPSTMPGHDRRPAGVDDLEPVGRPGSSSRVDGRIQAIRSPSTRMLTPIWSRSLRPSASAASRYRTRRSGIGHGSAEPSTRYDRAMVIPPPIAALPRFPLLDGPSPLQRAPALLGGLRRRRRGLDQARGPAAAGVRRQQAPEPGVPRRRGAGGRRRHPGHVRPPLVEPLPAHRRGRREGRARRPSRPHRPAAPAPGAEGPNQRLDELLGATVHVTATDDRAERAATVERVVAELRAAGGRPFVVGVGGTGPIGAAGQVLAGLELADQLAAAGIGEATRRPAVGDRRDPRRAADRASPSPHRRRVT